jgi:hypothetical protein
MIKFSSSRRQLVLVSRRSSQVAYRIFFDSDLLAGEHAAQLEFASLDPEPTAAGDSHRPTLEGIETKTAGARSWAQRDMRFGCGREILNCGEADSLVGRVRHPKKA